MDSEAAELSEVLGSVYDAAVDREAWAGALKHLTAFLGAHGTSIVFEHFAPRRGSFGFDHGMDDAFRLSYATHYATLNPLPVIGLAFDTDDVFGIGDVMPPEEFRATTFYKEWMAPQGFADALCAYLERSVDGHAIVLARATTGTAAEIERIRSRLALVTPHLRRAARIGRLLETSAGAFVAMEATLSGLSTAIFLVSKDGRVVYRNPAAERLVGDHQPLRLDDGRLAFVDPRAGRSLSLALAAAGRSDVAGGDADIDLPNGDAGPLRATVMPLVARGSRAPLEAFGAAAAILVAPAEATLTAGLPTIAAQFGFTKAEARALAALVAHDDIAGASRSLGVSAATVKSHLAAIYAKTGLSRQIDLVKLLARRTRPTVGVTSDQRP